MRKALRAVLESSAARQGLESPREAAIEQIKLLCGLVLARHPQVLAGAVEMGFKPASSDPWTELEDTVAGCLPAETVAKLRESLPRRYPMGCLVGEYCRKCKTALIPCSDCFGTGRKLDGYKCVRCRGSGKLCHLHQGDWQQTPTRIV